MSLKSVSVLSALLLAASIVGSAQAGTVSIQGTTAGSTLWNRPVANGSSSAVSFSTVGTAVPFSVIPISVSTTGTYSFASVSGIDNYTFLYVGAFDPRTPLANIVVGNDDLGTSASAGTAGLSSMSATSGFSVELTADTDYFFVTTGYANRDSGPFTASVTGRGAIRDRSRSESSVSRVISSAAVPLPASAAMGLAGFGAMALGRRRQA